MRLPPVCDEQFWKQFGQDGNERLAIERRSGGLTGRKGGGIRVTGVIGIDRLKPLPPRARSGGGFHVVAASCAPSASLAGCLHLRLRASAQASSIGSV